MAIILEPSKGAGRNHKSLDICLGYKKRRCCEPTENEKVHIRFLDGEEAFSFGRGITPTDIQVAVANKLGMFSPQVKIYGFLTGNLIYSFSTPESLSP